MPLNPKLSLKSRVPQSNILALSMTDDDDDFQNPVAAISRTRNFNISSFGKPTRTSSSQPLKPFNGTRSSKKSKTSIGTGKENVRITKGIGEIRGIKAKNVCHEVSTESRILKSIIGYSSIERNEVKGSEFEMGCSTSSVESKMVDLSRDLCSGDDDSIRVGVSAESNDRTRDKSDKGLVFPLVEARFPRSSLSSISRFDDGCLNEGVFGETSCKVGKEFKLDEGYSSNSTEHRFASGTDFISTVDNGCSDVDDCGDFVPGTRLNVLMNLCSELDEDLNSNGYVSREDNGEGDNVVECPLCGLDISVLNEVRRLIHTNDCLNNKEAQLVLKEDCCVIDEKRKLLGNDFPSYGGIFTDHGKEKGLKSETCCSSNSIEFSLPESSTQYSFRVDSACSVNASLGDSVSAGSDDKWKCKSDKGRILPSNESWAMDLNMDCNSRVDDECLKDDMFNNSVPAWYNGKRGSKLETVYLSNSIESRLLASRTDSRSVVDKCCLDEGNCVDFVPGDDQEDQSSDGLFECPLCQKDISDLTEEQRQLHINNCLDKVEQQQFCTDDCHDRYVTQKVVPPSDGMESRPPGKPVDVSPVLEWLQRLGLSRYEEAFVKEEIDWDTLQWLTEEDLLSIGVTALGPRKKIVNALNELRNGSTSGEDIHAGDSSRITPKDTSKLAGNKLITEYFPGSSINRPRQCALIKGNHKLERSNKDSGLGKISVRNHNKNGKLRDLPSWCCIPGTPFLVDAFRYLRSDCSHWFLTHFHIDHYQGLTRGFCYGKIYCSSVTARILNLKIGIPWDRLQILPLNQKISIAGVGVTCLDANHCPGSIIILFEPPNGKTVLHTGDFRFSKEMESMCVLQGCPIHTLILDTTYCNPQYDFPKQEAVIQFVIDAIQAEAFHPKTLFLIGSYTIGKERLFLEVARVLRKKVYVGSAKLRLLECLGLPEEDMQWFTVNEQESHIHVVPMWTIASFKRMKHICNQYSGRFNPIVAFSPTGWTYGKGKKKTPGRRWQQGTIIRYEVPYSEHSSFTELREFVRLVSPDSIIPSVNNDGPESAHSMVALLKS